MIQFTSKTADAFWWSSHTNLSFLLGINGQPDWWWNELNWDCCREIT